MGAAVAQPAQKTVLTFQPTWGTQPVEINHWYHLNTTDSVEVENFKCYISSIQLYQANTMMWKEVNSYHLLNIAHPSTFHILLDVPADVAYNSIRFNLGIDSATNVAGVLGGDLDPTHGMYWTWQSGYINLKLEGKSNLCATRWNEFSFHLGGYHAPYNALQTVQVTITQQMVHTMYIDLAAFFSAVQLTRHQQLMSPGAEAVQFSQLFSTVFKLP